MIFQVLSKLSVARDLPQIFRQTVPQTRPCNSKASVTKSVLDPWNCVATVATVNTTIDGLVSEITACDRETDGDTAICPHRTEA